LPGRAISAAPRSNVRDRRFSFELFPPKTPAGRQRFPSLVRELCELGPSFVSVTFGAGGSTREGSFESCAEILRTTDIPVTPHLSCIGSTPEELREQLDLYRAIGVRRVMALRGDVPENQPELPRAFRYANELVAFIRQQGHFHISVACYPEFHPESPSPQSCVEAFVRKARAGADEAISQYVFNNDAYYRFVEWVQKLGVDIPIVPGLMPIVDFSQIVRFSRFCGADIPAFIRKRMEQYEGDLESQRELGIELATRQAEQLLAGGAPGIHFYTLNRAEPTVRIWKALGLRPAAPVRSTHATLDGAS
jgi:methylenetetrahydrofolate reductase (NADPH)